jgi:hypothetical protein
MVLAGATVVAAEINALVEEFEPDVGYPAGVSGITTSEGVVLRFTIASSPYARRLVCMGHVYTTNTQGGVQQDAIWYAGSTVIGRARGDHPDALAPTTLSPVGRHDLPADTAVVIEMRVVRISGSGSVSTSVSSGLTAGSVIAVASP